MADWWFFCSRGGLCLCQRAAIICSNACVSYFIISSSMNPYFSVCAMHIFHVILFSVYFTLFPRLPSFTSCYRILFPFPSIFRFLWVVFFFCKYALIDLNRIHRESYSSISNRLTFAFLLVIFVLFSCICTIPIYIRHILHKKHRK